MASYPPPPPPPPQQAVEHGREPCPDRILDDIGGAFGMGALGGGAWHMYKGLKNSPKGYKLIGAIETVRRESPRIGGNFANWGLMFSVFDCTCLYVRKKVRGVEVMGGHVAAAVGRRARVLFLLIIPTPPTQPPQQKQQEDPFNAIMAGALTGGFLQLRSGVRPALRSAVFGGVLLAVIEGLGITLSKMTSPPPPSMPMPPGPGMGMGGGPPPPLPGAEGGLMGSTAPPPIPDLLGGGGGGGGLEGGIGGLSSSSSAGGDASGAEGSKSGGFWSWFGGGGSGGAGGSGSDGSGAPAPPPVKEQVFREDGFKHG